MSVRLVAPIPPARSRHSTGVESDPPTERESGAAILLLDDEPIEADPAAVILTCANCGAAMDERKCKLICRCGYFLSCSDYS